MRRILIGLVLLLAAAPAWAQSNRDICGSGSANPDQSIAACTALIQSGQESISNLAIDFYDRGNAYGAKGNNVQEIADQTQAITLNPGYASAYNNRAWAYHLNGEDAKGLPDANKGIELAPTANHFETRAEIYEKLGLSANAITDYRASLKIEPNKADSLAGLKRLGATP